MTSPDIDAIIVAEEMKRVPQMYTGGSSQFLKMVQSNEYMEIRSSRNELLSSEGGTGDIPLLQLQTKMLKLLHATLIEH